MNTESTTRFVKLELIRMHLFSRIDPSSSRFIVFFTEKSNHRDKVNDT